MPTSSSARPSRAALALVILLVAVLPAAAGLPSVIAGAVPPDHLVISEVVTGGASASDELVELYNPTDAALPLEGLELVYVSASGTTVTRRMSWAAGAPELPARRHLLLANDLGIYAAIADVLVSGGMAATGGSVALRIQGAASAIDAVGWGTATSTWLEGTPASAPPAGQSLERLPGGASGSTVDSDDNAADFVLRPLPGPQNLGSPPTPDPTATPTPSLAPTPELTPGPTSVPPTPDPATPAPATPAPPTPAPTPVPSATASPGVPVVPIATARALPDGTRVTVEGVTLSGSEFTDGGGYLVDASGGVAVLPSGEGFGRGRLLRVTGEIDDRFGQRTIRTDAGGIVDLGDATGPTPVTIATGAITEVVEGTLVRIAATVTSSASVLTSGTAFDIDDGSGPTRLVIGAATGIDVTAWRSGTILDLVGVVGQRDSTGTGTTGYRVQPRDPADVLDVGDTPSPTPVASEPAASETPSATPSPSTGVVSIAEARSAPKNTRVVVRGTVTLPTGIVDAQTAAIQDASGAILLRLGDEVGALALGQPIEVTGTRSTKSGMETLRVTEPPRRLGTGGGPSPIASRSGEAGEALEARLVTVRGGLVASARRASSGTVSFEIDDGSGPLRVVAGSALGLDRELLVAGAWVEVTGVLGQETTGSQPERGYRVWPRLATEVRLLAAPTGADGAGDGSGDPSGSGAGSVASASLDQLDRAAAQGIAIGATLVAGPWPEVGIGGLLWDGERLAALALADGPRVEAAMRSRRPPVPLELRGLAAAGGDVIGLPLVTLGGGVDAVLPGSGAPAPPATTLPAPGSPPRWVTLIGQVGGAASAQHLRTAAGVVAIDRRCDADEQPPRGTVAVVGVAAPGRPVVVPCGGMQSASVLARASVAGETTDTGLESGLGRPAGATAATSPMALVGAGLLGVAALSLAAAAAWARLRGSHDDGDGESDASAAAAEVEAEEGSPPGVPVLTLVRLPHERGP